MAEKREFSSGGTINEMSSMRIDTDSQKLNCEPNLGGVKPAMKGSYDPPDGKRPARAPEQKVMLPYGKRG